MRMLWKCIVSASNHCEVCRQRSSTQDLCNAIIHLAECGRQWITGTGVFSNSIKSATNTSRKFALAWQLGTLGLWCSFHRRCTSTHFAFQPAAAVCCDRRPDARASHYDENNHCLSNDCIAHSKVPWDLRLCGVTYWHLLATAASEWASEMGNLKS